jgi:hypothetical protein
MEIKRYIRDLPTEFGEKTNIIPILDKNLIKSISVK